VLDAGKTRDEPQPGGRKPAPGSLGLVQAFINSNYDLTPGNKGADLLDSTDGLDDWLRARGVAAGKATKKDLDRALEIREGLRDLLIARHEGREARLVEGFAVTVEMHTQGADLRQRGAALDLILALATAAMLDGSWNRLKACKECRWAFYDHSRNGAGNWCSMKVCGGRVKQRRHYRRVSRSGATA
jgi:predicted RNA-binding Zn ribbon-like protein